MDSAVASNGYSGALRVSDAAREDASAARGGVECGIEAGRLGEAAAGIAPDRLILEITEREIMEDHRAIVDVLGALHEQGVRISIDDFGTGFSSLTHLRRLPLHEIKIDQSFISGMLDRENDYIIARSIIDLAYNLGHRVVAEGVEDTATLALLRGLGCDIAQGFLFARPGPSERIRRQIESGPALDDEGILARGNA